MDDFDDLNEKVLDITQRQKRAMILRAHRAKIERARELAQKRMAPEKNIKKRAYAQARQIVRKRFAGARGAEYEKLGPSEKMQIDRAIDKKQALIKKIAMRLIPKVKQAEQQRLHSFMKGQSLTNTGAPEGKTVSEDIDAMFEQLIGDVQMSPKSDKEKQDKREKKSKSPIVQYSKFSEESDAVSAVYQAIAKKAGKSGIDIDVLGEVYDRGMDAWSEDMPVSQQQYAFARVNSFINKGRSYFEEDADLHEMKTVTNRSHAKALTIKIGGREHSYRKYGWGLHHPTYGPLKDAQFKSRAEMKDAMEKHPHYNPKLAEETELDEAIKGWKHAGRDINKMRRQQADAAKEVKLVRLKKNGEESKLHGATSKHASEEEARRKHKQLVGYNPGKGIAHNLYVNNKLVDTLKEEVEIDEAFSNWSFEMKPGDKTKVLSGDHRGKRGVVVSKHDNGAVYKIKHADGSVMKHHISTLEEPITEARAPGRAYVEPLKHPQSGEQIGWKSSTKWGKVKYWRNTDSAKAKAMQHAGLNEAVQQQTNESWISSPIKWRESVRAKHGDVTFKRKSQPGVTGKSDTHATNSEGKVVGVYQHHNKMGRVYEEVQQTNENFIDGKGPGKPGDAARHGLKGKSAAELRKIRSSETASPRTKQLAHWMLNMHHNEETELDEAGSKYNIPMARVKPKKAPTRPFISIVDELGIPAKHLDRARSIYSKTKDVEAVKKFVSSIKEGLKDPEDNPCWNGYKPVGTKRLRGKSVPNCVPEAVEKVTGTNCKNCTFWRDDLVRPVSKDELNENGGLKAPSKEYLKMSKEVDLATLPGKATVSVKGFCDNDKVMEWVTERMCCALWDGEGTKREFKGDATFMEQDDTGNGTRLMDKEARNSKLRKKIEIVDREPPHTEYTRHAELKKKIIDEEGNSQPNPRKRLIGTDSLVKAYKKDTPGQMNESLNEAFNIAYAAGVGVTLTAADLGMRTQGGFALHPSVIAEMEAREAEEMEEEVKSADVKGEVVPAHTKVVTDPQTGAIKQVTVPGHVRRAKKNKTIIPSGNVTDGKSE